MKTLTSLNTTNSSQPYLKIKYFEKIGAVNLRLRPKGNKFKIKEIL